MLNIALLMTVSAIPRDRNITISSPNAIMTLSFEEIDDLGTRSISSVLLDLPKVDHRTRTTSPKLQTDIMVRLRGLNPLSGIENIEILKNGLDDYNTISNVITFIGRDMNFLTPQVDLKQLPQVSYRATFEPGLIFVPSMPGFQSMINIGRTDYSLMYPFQNLLASVGFVHQEPPKILTLCANMELKEPSEKVAYMPFSNADKVVVGLAQLTAKEGGRGPEDQGRLWMYTDHASLADINKRLKPPMVPGYYVRALKEINDLNGWKPEDFKNSKIWAPNLIFAPTGDKESLKFYIEHMTKNFSKELSEELKHNRKESSLLFTSSGAALKKDHISWLMEILLSSSNENIQLGMLDFLASTVPQDMRKPVSQLEGFAYLAPLANSANEKVKKSAESVIALYKS